MPGPPPTKARISLRVHALSTLSTLAAAGACCLSGPTQADCPQPASLASVPSASDRQELPTDVQQDVELQVDSLEATRDGTWDLKGEVSITQGERKLTTTDATYDPATQSLSTENGVTYSDPALKVEGSGAEFDAAGSVDL